MTDSSSPGAIAPTTVSEADLEEWGRGIGAAAASGTLPLPLVLALRGPLGAGKSVLARAVARGAGVEGPMPSPTYNLLFTYRGTTRSEDGGVAGPDEPLMVHHLDLYRLEHPDDVWELGWQELGEGRQIVLIEWPERAEGLLPPDRWDVRLAFPDDADDARTRILRVEPRGDAPMPPGAGP